MLNFWHDASRKTLFLPRGVKSSAINVCKRISKFVALVALVAIVALASLVTDWRLDQMRLLGGPICKGLPICPC